MPAYNAGPWIAETLQSALAQTWPRTEIIVVDDGSTDNTVAVARRFESTELKVVTKANEGAAAARNHAFSLCQGDFIQWLDADDLLSPGKIELQLAALAGGPGQRLLAACPWGYFAYRPQAARFMPTSLWEDLSPADWMVRKFSENLHQQTATWLTSRELAEAAGPWDPRMLSDDDGEYFSRVLMASAGTRFVRAARVYYRMTQASRLSYIGSSTEKMLSLMLSLQLNSGYLRSLEDSDRVRRALIRYFETWSQAIDPARHDILAQMESMAAELGGSFRRAPLRRKYRWLAPWIGESRAWRLQLTLPFYKNRVLAGLDRLLWAATPSRGGVHRLAVDG